MLVLRLGGRLNSQDYALLGKERTCNIRLNVSSTLKWFRLRANVHDWESSEMEFIRCLILFRESQRISCVRFTVTCGLSIVIRPKAVGFNQIDHHLMKHLIHHRHQPARVTMMRFSGRARYHLPPKSYIL